MATFELSPELSDEYNHLFALARIRPEHRFEVDAIVDRIFSPRNIAQYERVKTSTGVPAFVVGIIHNLEASLSFEGHLHNGDPLSARTVQVPEGRPRTGNPPFEWVESAIDALTMHDLNDWTNWSVPGIAYILERYNGFGYRLHHPHVKSPYLWSFTTIYAAGKYVGDGKWSDSAVSKQCGGMAALKRMIETGKAPIAMPDAPVDAGDVAITPSVSVEHGAAPPPAAEARPYPGHILKMDSNGPDVTAIQSRLRELGINPGAVDGDFGDSTEAGVKLFQARAVDDGGNPLEIDGIVGRKTWDALFGLMSPPAGVAPPPAGSLRARVLQVAAEEVGVREVPLGSNRGPRVDEYLNAVGSGLLGEPWCMAFVYFCFAQAATALHVSNPAPQTAGVKRSWQLAQSLPSANIVPAAKAKEDPSLVAPGMVFYIDTGSNTGHAGLVADVIGGTLVTIEGNTTSVTGSREGIGVFQRSSRKIKDINLGFIGFG
jgi:lysozyme family protein